jgi:hypothetical protein
MGHAKQILQYLHKRKSITPLDALTLFGCMRLAARIQDLRDEGHKILTHMEKHNGKKYARYVYIKGIK